MNGKRMILYAKGMVVFVIDIALWPPIGYYYVILINNDDYVFITVIVVMIMLLDMRVVCYR
jgi:hypothetical protein